MASSWWVLGVIIINKEGEKWAIEKTKKMKLETDKTNGRSLD